MDSDRDRRVDTGYYLERRFQDPYDRERKVQPFYLKSIHDFYASYGKYLDPTSSKLLEFGGGPCIYPLISAGPHVSDVTFADYDAVNLDAVQAWRDGSSGAHDWGPYFKYVLQELEKEKEDIPSQSQSRQLDLKKKINQFKQVDIRSDDLFYGKRVVGEKFDIVSSNFCLDAVAETVEEYGVFLKRLKGLVRSGGFLIGLVSLEESYWMTAKNEKKPHLFLTEQEVIQKYEEAGFEVKSHVVIRVEEAAQFKLNDCKALMFIVTVLRD